MTETMTFLAQTAPPSESSLSLCVICWIVIGMIIGFVGSKILDQRGDAGPLGIFLALIGSVAGGVTTYLIRPNGSTILGICVGAVVAIVFVLLYFKVLRRSMA